MKFIHTIFGAIALVAFWGVIPALGADTGTDKSRMKREAAGGITLKIAGGEIQGDNKVIRVKQGDDVRLNLMADKTTEVHLHGYDIEKTVSPGKPAVMSFRARVAGRFPVTEHGSHSHGKKSGGHSEKVLFYLEVHP